MNKRSLVFLFSLLLSSVVFISATAVSGQEPTIPREQIWQEADTMGGPVSNLNPYNPSPPGTYYQMYETLAYADAFSGEIKPLLAESWSWVDDYTFEVKVRPEAHWMDGTPVTAEDVIFSLDTQSDPTYGGYRSPEVETWSAPDEHTVWIHVREEHPRSQRVLDDFFTDILPEARWSKLLEEYGEDIVSATPNLDHPEDIITSGPYTVYHIGADRVIYERVDDYWGNALGWFYHPRYHEHFYYGSNEATVRGAYEGRLSEHSGVGFNEPQWFKDHRDYMLSWDIDASPEAMFMHEASCLPIVPNLNIPILRENWLRVALAYATDARKALESGWAMCGVIFPPSFLHPDLPDYDLYVNEDVIRETFEETEYIGGVLCVTYSPEKAIEILQENCEGSVEEGWTYQGEKIGPWTIQAVNGWADVMIEAKVIAKSWSDIGIPTEPIYPEYGTWSSNYVDENYIWTQMWSWNHIVETAAPVPDTFFDIFVVDPAAPNIWYGSPGHYPRFFNGDYPPLPNTSAKVEELTMKLYMLEPKTDEFIETVKELQTIIVPQVPFIQPFGKSSVQGFVTDRWVNWPVKDDPYEHRLDGVQPAITLMLKHVRPKFIETTSFRLSSEIVEAGEPTTALVTLENTADCELEYQVMIRKGPAQPGPGPEPLAWKVVTVPPHDSEIIDIEITIDEVGTHILTVDDWRIDKYDPGEPLEVALSVTEPAEYSIKDAIDAAQSAKTAAESARTAAEEAKTTAEEAKTSAIEAKEAAENAAPVWMVWTSMAIGIVVALVGAYIIAKSLK